MIVRQRGESRLPATGPSLLLHTRPVKRGVRHYSNGGGKGRGEPLTVLSGGIQGIRIMRSTTTRRTGLSDDSDFRAIFGPYEGR